MRILSAGDLHDDLLSAERLSLKARENNVDLVILCGDLIHDSSTVNILKPFKDKNQKVLLIPGNHDGSHTTQFLAELNNARNLHGYSVRYENVGIFGFGLTHHGIHRVSEEEMLRSLKYSFKKISYLDKKILVTHVHPSKSKMSLLTKFVPGSDAVLKAIYEFAPDIHICGHVHEAEGLEEVIGTTRVINPGKEGFIFDI